MLLTERPVVQSSVASATIDPVPPNSSKSTGPVPSIALPIKYQYYQSNSSLTISVMAKNILAEDLIVKIEPTHLHVSVRYKLISSEQEIPQEEVVIHKSLWAQIDCEKSKYTLYKTKVEIILAKIDQEIWPALEASGAPKLPSASAVIPPPALSNSEGVQLEAGRTDKPMIPKPYSSKKDWEKLGSQISKELDEEKPEGEEALQKLFQQIYKDATPETKMAMKKSFQTSGGTVLSTNWNEVSGTDYEKQRQAPKGMEWRNWEGEKVPQKEDS